MHSIVIKLCRLICYILFPTITGVVNVYLLFVGMMEAQWEPVILAGAIALGSGIIGSQLKTFKREFIFSFHTPLIIVSLVSFCMLCNDRGIIQAGSWVIFPIVQWVLFKAGWYLGMSRP